jgi:hypothetical protein
MGELDIMPPNLGSHVFMNSIGVTFIQDGYNEQPVRDNEQKRPVVSSFN